jgi:hypothetical protein
MKVLLMGWKGSTLQFLVQLFLGQTHKAQKAQASHTLAY